jgi:hypothetical protein
MINAWANNDGGWMVESDDVWTSWLMEVRTNEAMLDINKSTSVGFHNVFPCAD